MYKLVQNLRRISLFLNNRVAKRPNIKTEMADHPSREMHPSDLFYNNTTRIFFSYMLFY